MKQSPTFNTISKKQKERIVELSALMPKSKVMQVVGISRHYINQIYKEKGLKTYKSPPKQPRKKRYERSVSLVPDQKKTITRPPAQYSNRSPYGLANEI